MRIDELCEYAKDHGFDNLRFKFTNLKGDVKHCMWLDAYLGLFRIDGNDGFITVKQWKELAGDAFDFEIDD